MLLHRLSQLLLSNIILLASLFLKRSCNQILVEKMDGLCMRFYSVAAAESRQDLLDSLTLSMRSLYPSFRSRRDSAAT
ncbi:hypothetical protein Y032_0610g623 [Ancylostoma ceylanicum]|uniref:Secreted protein n=1 Tax=Ancylostoma ceylanicum TaxID=53326 RepID=A0A016WMK2_9BILA|nr:hypothetical protein Y032_0610g623 [Ancylostoma ceylanicum]